MHKVLVVEDEPSVCESLCEMFQDVGYTVDSAPDVSSAYNKIQKGEFDLALIDIRLPASDEGIKLGARVRELQRKGKIRRIGILLITAVPKKEYAEDAINICQPDGFIKKQWPRERVLEIAADYFKRREEDDKIINAFKMWAKHNPDFTIELTCEDGEPRVLTADDIVDEMVKGTPLGNNFKDSLVRVTAEILYKSITNKKNNTKQS